MPGPSAEEQAHDRRITAQLHELIALATQRNLDTAVQLAALASRRQLPKELEDHFCELGRRYAHLANPVARARAAKPSLRLAAENGVAVRA
jgi:hypothetical protein